MAAGINMRSSHPTAVRTLVAVPLGVTKIDLPGFGFFLVFYYAFGSVGHINLKRRGI